MMRLTAIPLAMVVLLSAISIESAFAQGSAQSHQEILTNPALFKAQAPDNFQVRFETSKGDIVVEVTRAWAPNGADRFYNLVKNGYYDGCRFFRVVEDFMAQFGINGDPKVNSGWMNARINDDPRKQSNTRGFVTFAFVDANSRATQVFINFSDNSYLDKTFPNLDYIKSATIAAPAK